MTEKHKNAIKRGIKRMQRRRRMSEAMKASWERRKASSNSTLAVDAAESSTPTLTHIWTDDDLVDVARTLVGRENVRMLLTNAIKGVLLN